jgi:hypothetical protein
MTSELNFLELSVIPLVLVLILVFFVIIVIISKSWLFVAVSAL